MEMMVLSFFGGMIFSLMLVLLITREKTNGNTNDVSSSIPNDCYTSGKRNGLGEHWYNFEIGSEEETEALENLSYGLLVMKKVTGLCETEKEMLEDAVKFIQYELAIERELKLAGEIDEEEDD